MKKKFFFDKKREKITDGFTLAGYSMYQAKRKNI